MRYWFSFYDAEKYKGKKTEINHNEKVTSKVTSLLLFFINQFSNMLKHIIPKLPSLYAFNLYLERKNANVDHFPTFCRRDSSDMQTKIFHAFTPLTIIIVIDAVVDRLIK
jgi:hypothetical protein